MKSKAGESAGPLLYLHMFSREGCVEGVFNSYLVQNTFHRFHNSWCLILSVTVPLYSFCIALFLNSYCEINTLPSIDVILIQRLFYWHYLLLTIYWSNIMLVLFHCYFTIMLLHCSIHTNLCLLLHTYHSKWKRHNGNNACMKYRMQWLIKRSEIDMTWISLEWW